MEAADALVERARGAVGDEEEEEDGDDDTVVGSRW